MRWYLPALAVFLGDCLRSHDSRQSSREVTATPRPLTAAPSATEPPRPRRTCLDTAPDFGPPGPFEVKGWPRSQQVDMDLHASAVGFTRDSSTFGVVGSVGGRGGSHVVFRSRNGETGSPAAHGVMRKTSS